MRLTTILLLACLAKASAQVPAAYIAPEITVVEFPGNVVSNSSSVSIVTNMDAVCWSTNVPSGGYWPAYSISPTPLSASVSNTNVARYRSGSVYTLSAGDFSVSMLLGLPNGGTFRKVIRLSGAVQSGGSTNYLFVSNVVGSVSEHVSSALRSRTNGNSLLLRKMFNTRSPSTATYVRNPSFFLSDIEGIEAYPAGNNSGSSSMNGIAISPRHILSVAHTGSQLGQVLHFVNRTNNATVSRTVVDYMRVTTDSDMCVALLSEPLPASIVTAQLAPGLLDKLPHYRNNGEELRKMPIVMFNQDVMPALNYVSGYFSNYATACIVRPNASSDTRVATWQQMVRGGDSGSPGAIVLNGRLVALTVWSTTMGGAVASELPVQEAMNTLTSRNSFTNETLSAANLSSFTTY